MSRILPFAVFLALVGFASLPRFAEAQNPGQPMSMNSERSVRTSPVPVPNLSKPSNVQSGPTPRVPDGKSPKASLGPMSRGHGSCSVPLLRVQPDPNTNFSTKSVPARPVDRDMVVKPSAPSCDDQASVQRPAAAIPNAPGHR